jgi:hypothetical protein
MVMNGVASVYVLLGTDVTTQKKGGSSSSDQNCEEESWHGIGGDIGDKVLIILCVCVCVCEPMPGRAVAVGRPGGACQSADIAPRRARRVYPITWPPITLPADTKWRIPIYKSVHTDVSSDGEFFQECLNCNQWRSFELAIIFSKFPPPPTHTHTHARTRFLFFKCGRCERIWLNQRRMNDFCSRPLGWQTEPNACCCTGSNRGWAILTGFRDFPRSLYTNHQIGAGAAFHFG